MCAKRSPSTSSITFPRVSRSAAVQQQQPNLWQIFQAIDTDRSGRISAQELQRALSNGTSWRPFNAETCRILIAMFDKDNDGGISFDEFEALWNYVNDWCQTFRAYDADNSGNIDREELTNGKVPTNALTTFGYRLSPGFYEMLMHKFDRTHSGRLDFDEFVQCCVMLQTLTAAFASKDRNGDGWIQIYYEEFLQMVLQSKI